MRTAYQIKFYGDESTEKRDKKKKRKLRSPRRKTAAMKLHVFAVMIRCIVLKRKEVSNKYTARNPSRGL